jgi:lysophospholipase L1-like esterase
MSFMGASALSRLDGDVFSIPGLTHIVILEGINDIGMTGLGGTFGDAPPITPEEIIVAYSQIIARAHEHGVKVIGSTLLPFEGAWYYSESKERVREAVNEWIRTSRKFDQGIDFDAVLRDVAKPTKLAVEYDPGDHLHPSAAGYQKMGDSVDSALFGH